MPFKGKGEKVTFKAESVSRIGHVVRLHTDAMLRIVREEKTGKLFIVRADSTAPVSTTQKIFGQVIDDFNSVLGYNLGR